MDTLNVILSVAAIPVVATCFIGHKLEARICGGYLLVTSAVDWLITETLGTSANLKADMIMSAVFVVLSVGLVIRKSNGPIWPLAMAGLAMAQMIGLVEYTNAETLSAWATYVSLNRLTYGGELAALLVLPYVHDWKQLLRHRTGRDVVRHRNLGWVPRTRSAAPEAASVEARNQKHEVRP